MRRQHDRSRARGQPACGAGALYDFVNNEALPGTGIDRTASGPASTRWSPTSPRRTRTCSPGATNCKRRSTSGTASASSAASTPASTKQFLTDIGYLQPEPADFTITTSGVDDEITTTAGPQLVVPILNARFALNAANARWGSLYDALYGTDVIAEDDGAEKGRLQQIRGDKVIAYARGFLDAAVPLASGSWTDVTGLSVVEGSWRSRRAIR